MISVGVKDGKTHHTACVTERGQMVVAPLDFSKFYLNTATVNDTAVNVVLPKPNKRFVITAIILGADKNVGAGGATVDLFEATGPTVSTITTSILEDEIAKSTTRVLTGLNIIVTEGVWVNVKTDDNNVRANISGYYVDA
jgi:hypothetical protein